GVTDSGTVYAFSTSGGSPLLIENNPSPAVGDQFGYSLASERSGTFLAIGAPGDDFGATDAGRAYLASFTGGLIPSGTASTPTPGGGGRCGAGVGVAVRGALRVGAPSDAPGGAPPAGPAYLSDPSVGGAPITFNTPPPAAGDRFGSSVAMGGN